MPAEQYSTGKQDEPNTWMPSSPEFFEDFLSKQRRKGLLCTCLH